MKDLPEIIYKYRNWTSDFHKKVLTKNQLFLAAPSDFNDPFDCRITKNHHLLNTPEKIELYINKGINENLAFLIADRRNIEFEKRQLRDRLKDLDQYQKEFEEINNANTDRYLGVLSLSSRWDSILMWSHYGDFHRGYCIGFDEEKLRNTGFFGKGGYVTYSDEVPSIDPFNDDVKQTSFYQTHYKAKDWEYEEEYRLTKLYFDKPAEESNRLITLPDECLREVIIGMKTTDAHKLEIIENCKAKNLPVFQAYKDSSEFKVKRRPIR